MTLVAGVDSSTQSVKIVVCDLETGSIVRSARASHPSWHRGAGVCVAGGLSGGDSRSGPP